MVFGVDSFKDMMELLSFVVVTLGLPVAVFQYVQSARSEQRSREDATYNAVDDKFIEFQKLCLMYPRLDVWDLPQDAPVSLDVEEKRQELIAFTLLFSIFERGVLMRADMSGEQWAGWHQYMRSYCGRANFRDAWRKSGKSFDRRFEIFMEELLSVRLCDGESQEGQADALAS